MKADKHPLLLVKYSNTSEMLLKWLGSKLNWNCKRTRDCEKILKNEKDTSSPSETTPLLVISDLWVLTLICKILPTLIGRFCFPIFTQKCETIFNRLCSLEPRWNQNPLQLISNSLPQETVIIVLHRHYSILMMERIALGEAAHPEMTTSQLHTCSKNILSTVSHVSDEHH